jgi:hypothetical protein
MASDRAELVNDSRVRSPGPAREFNEKCRKRGVCQERSRRKDEPAEIHVPRSSRRGVGALFDIARVETNGRGQVGQQEARTSSEGRGELKKYAHVDTRIVRHPAVRGD